MIRTELNRDWRMRCMSGGDWQSAVVPGTVYTDLLRNGDMEDPYWKDNEDSACALMEDDYDYECRFVPDEAMMRSRTRLLKFDGLDTCASVYLNGELLGEPCNMHRIWEYDVTDSLREGENLLNVQFHSPLRYIAQAYKKYGNIGNDDTYEGFMHLRKAHYMFGWDWGAHLPDAGIFRSVSLLGIEEGRIGSVYIRQRHEEGKVTLLFEAEASCISERGDGSSPAGRNTGEPEQKICWQAAVTSPDGKTYRAVLADGRGALVIEDPQLWWPNGLGDQPLYDVEVSMRIGEKECDVWKKRIGLRTLTVKREKDAWGESFAHEVNGVCFFAMGADYIPEDHLLGRRSRERTQRLLEDCRLANFNSIRVWGGGFYPDDWFYDLCDELGLVVWQDFMFACSVYELTEEFEANIRQEFIDNITRLRHHASLGLWCGNN
ncbi:MAG TPA: glycoside hydrolase family 2 protein, partial [Candidatus Mediterraneibacter gallistercoris]|nr:glycoside hydrolase family 2 protein [Candidatus Mediterraneibacter gallistercoris]